MAWDYIKFLYDHNLEDAEITATSTASGYSADNLINRLETKKWKSSITTEQYINFYLGLYNNSNNTDASAPWDAYYDGTYLFVADQSLGVLSFSASNGVLTNIDDDDQGGVHRSIHGDGAGYLFAACEGDGLRSFSHSAGTITYIDADDQGGTYYGVYSDGTYIFTACGGDGLRSHSHSSGTITYIDADDQGGDYYDVAGDGTYIFVAAGASGIMSYSHSSGTLSHISTEHETGTYYGIFIDDNYVYAATSGGLEVYSHSSGTLSHVSTTAVIGGAYGGYSDGEYTYSAGAISGGLSRFSNSSGVLTFIDNSRLSGQYNTIASDGEYLFIPCGVGGVRTYYPGLLYDSLVDYIVIHGHNLGTIGATYTFQYSYDGFNGDINNAFTGVVASNDNTILHEFTQDSNSNWRLKIENATAVPEIAIMYFGETVELDYATNSYDPNAEDDKAVVNESQTGFVTGIYDKYIKRAMNLIFTDADSTLYNKLVAWHDEVGRENFVVAWDTGEHSTEVFLMRHVGQFNNPLVRGGNYRNTSIKLVGRK